VSIGDEGGVRGKSSVLATVLATAVLSIESLKIRAVALRLLESSSAFSAIWSKSKDIIFFSFVERNKIGYISKGIIFSLPPIRTPFE